MAYNGYSAKVSLRLAVGETTLELSHVGRSWLIVMGECGQFPECKGDLIIKIGERETKSEVFLPHGIPGPRQKVAFF